MSIRVDQEIDGQLTENIIPVRLLAMRHKADKTLNKNYDRIKGYGEKFISLSAVNPGEEHTASKVSLVASASESIFAGKDGRVVDKVWQLTTNFVNDKRASDVEGATFEITGYLVGKRPELDKEENETGRLILSICVVGYKGKANIFDFYASGNCAAHIEKNWELGETIKAGGIISMTHKVVEWEEEMGFGEPIKHRRTESRRELVITRGSHSGLDEEYSYDGTDIKNILEARMALKKELERGASAQKPAQKASHDYGF